MWDTTILPFIEFLAFRTSSGISAAKREISEIENKRRENKDLVNKNLLFFILPPFCRSLIHLVQDFDLSNPLISNARKYSIIAFSLFAGDACIMDN
jgi:hypothetical protein